MRFVFKKFGFDGVFLINTKLLTDNRGRFVKVYCKSQFQKAGIIFDLNEHFYSVSRKRTIRGLHYQKTPHGQSKLVYVSRGKIFDVVVDIRNNSKTYGKWKGVTLSSNNGFAVFIPPGFAHGFQALEESTVEYICGAEYSQLDYTGVRWNDPSINIRWPLGNPILSENDNGLPLLSTKK